MKLLAILLLVLLIAGSPVMARGKRCRSSTQCDYESVCDDGYCYTIDEMFEKYEMKDYGRKSAYRKSSGRNGGYGGYNYE